MELFQQGNQYLQQKKFSEAQSTYNKISIHWENYYKVQLNKSSIYIEWQEYQKAQQICENIGKEYPQYYRAFLGSAIAAYKRNRFGEVVFFCNKLLSLEPNCVEGYLLLGETYKQLFQYDIGWDYVFKAIQMGHELKTQPTLNYSQILVDNLDTESKSYTYAYQYSFGPLTLLYTHFPPENIFNMHKYITGLSQSSIDTFENNYTTHNDKIHLAYITGNLKMGFVYAQFNKILEHHDLNKFKIFIYYNDEWIIKREKQKVIDNDNFDVRIKYKCENWRHIINLSNHQIAKQLEKDQIDMIIDFDGCTRDGCDTLFCNRVCPLQISYFGYPQSITAKYTDYKIVDSFTDPPDKTEHLYTEKLIRLPESFLCFCPYNMDKVSVMKKNKTFETITLGCCNKFDKLNKEVLQCWKEILIRNPHTKLILKSSGDFKSQMHIHSVLDYMNHIFGEVKHRVEYYSSMEESFYKMENHYGFYNLIDIALDPFPYNGTTTTFETLYMGTPMITLEGNSHVSRVGVSILNNIGCSELIAKSTQEYIEKVTQLCSNSEKIKNYHDTLRDKYNKSIFTDYSRFTKQLENSLIDIKNSHNINELNNE